MHSKKKKEKIYKSFLKLLLVVTLVLFLKTLSLCYRIKHEGKDMKKLGKNAVVLRLNWTYQCELMF